LEPEGADGQAETRGERAGLQEGLVAKFNMLVMVVDFLRGIYYRL